MNAVTQEQFPQVEGRSLTGIEYNLPNDFKGDLNLVVIGFYQWQQLICDMWLDFAKTLKSDYTNFEYYEIPLLDDEPMAIEDVLYGDLIESIDDETVRSKVITLYDRKGDMFEQFGVLNNRKVGALLVKSDGTIVWQCQGFPKESLKKSLKKLLHDYFIVQRC